MASCSAVKRVARFPWSRREEEREHMPLYMSQVAYTSEAVAALTRNPEDRVDVFERLVEGMGGRLLSFYYSFGEYDVLVIYEAPDQSTAAATVLLSAEEGMQAIRKAGEATYRAPGQQ